MSRTRILLVAVVMCISLVAFMPTQADPPPGYYDSVDDTNSTTLRTTTRKLGCAAAHPSSTWDSGRAGIRAE